MSAKREKESGGQPVYSTIRKRGGRIKPKPRKAKEAERVYGPVEFREWLHALPCAVCGFVGATQQAHAKTGGTGRKSDARFTFPACGPHWSSESGHSVMVEGCHAESGHGVKTFEKKYGVTLLELADATWAKWQSVCQTRI